MADVAGSGIPKNMKPRPPLRKSPSPPPPPVMMRPVAKTSPSLAFPLVVGPAAPPASVESVISTPTDGAKAASMPICAACPTTWAAESPRPKPEPKFQLWVAVELSGPTGLLKRPTPGYATMKRLPQLRAGPTGCRAWAVRPCAVAARAASARIAGVALRISRLMCPNPLCVRA